MSKDFILFYDPFNFTGTDGFLNYKMSGFNSNNGNNSGGNKNIGGYIVIIVILLILELLNSCS